MQLELQTELFAIYCIRDEIWLLFDAFFKLVSVTLKYFFLNPKKPIKLFITINELCQSWSSTLKSHFLKAAIHFF